MRRSATFGIIVMVLASASRLFAADAIWLEGESPASVNVKSSTAGWGRKDFLSDEKWLHIAIEAEKVDKDLPADGALIRYPFHVSKAGNYEVWNRVGFEFVRSPFDWRIDSGEWSRASPNELTTDLMEVDFFCEVAWLKLGDSPVSVGDHTLEIRLPKTKGKDGKIERILYCSDALCLSPEPFHPDGKTRPGEDRHTPRDRQAAETHYAFPPLSGNGQQTSIPLKGLWEICRDDEQKPGEVAAPIKEIPAHPVWRAIDVPGDKGILRPDLIFAHRLWYRTRVDLPAGAEGRSWLLVFPQNSLNTTVFVNGTFRGFGKDPFARFQVDISKAIKPGVNEVYVGIRDAWYGRTANPDDPLKLRKTFNLPRKFFHDGFQDLAYPVWNSPQSGILTTPTLVSAGPVYVSDVFVKPSVSKKALGVEVTLTNTTPRDISGIFRWRARSAQPGATGREFDGQAFGVAANASKTLEFASPWAEAKLWWPNDPTMYQLETSLSVDGKTVDVCETPFGFREWKVDGTKFTLNGVPWTMWGDVESSQKTRESWLDHYRKTGRRLMRLATAGQGGEVSGWMGMSPDEALDFFDQSGVVVRRNSTLDGEAIGYVFSESDPAMKARNGGSELKLALMRNVRDQFVAQVKGERNHPSIQIWSMENEFAYINLINLLGNSPNMDAYEREEQKIADAVLAVDPTRTVMADGGGAFKANTMPVHGDHYVATFDARYPDLAYESFPEGGGRGRWKWDGKRPRYIGEEFFANGINPADYAMWGGESAFQGKAQTRGAVAFLYRMLTEGYRWGGHYAAWHLWLGDEAPGQYASTPWRAAFVRQYDWSFASGSNVGRTFGVFNDTQYDDPITFTRTLSIAGRVVSSKSTEHRVAPGSSVKFDEELVMPQVTTRQEGELVLTLAVRGVEIFRDIKAVSILPAPGGHDLGKVTLYDPKGTFSTVLNARIGPVATIKSLDDLPGSTRVLIVAPDAIGPQETTSSRLAAFAAPGRTVIVLDQVNPLRYQSTPAGLEPASASVRDGSGVEAVINEGRTAFIEDAGHPAFLGLAPRDFFTWGPDHVVYRNAYVKPTRNGRSLVQVGPRLQNTAVVEVPAGKGLLILCQLEIGKKLATNPVARQLLANLIAYGSTYKQEFREVAAVIDDPELGKALDAIGLRYSRESDPVKAVSRSDVKLAIVSATPSNLKALAAEIDQVNSFTRGGGYLLFHGLTPEGLADYNKVVGVEHLIRPFRRERVTFPVVKNPLTAGLTIGDIVLSSGERMFPWSADEYLASDVFTHVVDYDEIAPFATSPFFAYDKITNGFVGSDGWPLIIDFPAPKDGKPFDIPINLPRPEVVTEYTHIASTNYMPTTEVRLNFDGVETLDFPLKPTNEPQSFAIQGHRPARKLILQIARWEPLPGKGINIGIDNISIKVARSPEFLATVRPMLNVGGLMQYVRGPGGVVLCNLRLKDVETVPVNVAKKRAILATVLRNLRAPFSGGTSVIPGAGLAYTTVDLSKQANQYRNDRGWFGDPKLTFAALPTGKQTFAGVNFDVYDFATSPVPTVIIPDASGVKTIPVNRKADALFFLQAARIDARRNPREVLENKGYEIARYVIHYADGQSVTIPIRAEIDVDDYRQASPAPLPGAQLAWTRPYEGTKLSAVAYSKPWDNPRPGVEIRGLDVLPGEAKGRGKVALIAVTAATAQP